MDLVFAIILILIQNNPIIAKYNNRNKIVSWFSGW